MSDIVMGILLFSINEICLRTKVVVVILHMHHIIKPNRRAYSTQ